MRTVITMGLVLVLAACNGCGSQDPTPDQTEVAQPAVVTPTVDLQTAVVLSNLEAIRQHIEAGSDLNVLEPSRASTPLITAAALGKTEVASLLIDAGADLNYQNNDGSTALHTAAFFGRVEIVKVLLAKGADKTLKNNTGRTALDIVTMPFEDHQMAYEAIGAGLKPAGFVADLTQLESARPLIAEMLES